MSHFAVYECNVSNVEFIKKALVDMGLGHQEDTTITDYYGQKREAEIAVTKDGRLLPIGWVREEGQLGLQADWYKVPYSEKEFTNQISQLHAKYQVIETCEENRWNVDDVVVNENGEIEVFASTYA